VFTFINLLLVVTIHSKHNKQAMQNEQNNNFSYEGHEKEASQGKSKGLQLPINKSAS